MCAHSFFPQVFQDGRGRVCQDTLQKGQANQKARRVVQLLLAKHTITTLIFLSINV